MICRTKRISLFSHGFKNYRAFIAMIATIGLGCFLVYVPYLNTGLTLYPLRFLWWLSAIPFAFIVMCHGELCKFLIRKYKGRWLSKELTF
jgi:sodium/potassium-transporting ATPase subunit alpha